MKAIAILLLSGCSQLLGLDNTTLSADAPEPDGPIGQACLGAPATCASSTGRTACGQLFDTGANAGKPLTVATPQAAACSGSEGPCAYSVAAYAQAAYFAGDKTMPVAGIIDDCGRYVVPDIDVDTADVVIELTPSAGDFKTTATIINGRPAMTGEDKDIAAFALTGATLDEWSAQVSMAAVDVTSGFMISYTAVNNLPTPDVQVANDSGLFYTNPPGSPPWSRFFAANGVFGTLDPALTATANTGTAIAVLPIDVTIQLEGQRTGHARCVRPGLKQIANTWIHVIITNC